MNVVGAIVDFRFETGTGLPIGHCYLPARIVLVAPLDPNSEFIALPLTGVFRYAHRHSKPLALHGIEHRVPGCDFDDDILVRFCGQPYFTLYRLAVRNAYPQQGRSTRTRATGKLSKGPG